MNYAEHKHNSRQLGLFYSVLYSRRQKKWGLLIGQPRRWSQNDAGWVYRAGEQFAVKPRFETAF